MTLLINGELPLKLVTLFTDFPVISVYLYFIPNVRMRGDFSGYKTPLSKISDISGTLSPSPRLIDKSIDRELKHFDLLDQSIRSHAAERDKLLASKRALSVEYVTLERQLNSLRETLKSKKGTLQLRCSVVNEGKKKMKELLKSRSVAEKEQADYKSKNELLMKQVNELLDQLNNQKIEAQKIFVTKAPFSEAELALIQQRIDHHKAIMQNRELRMNEAREKEGNIEENQDKLRKESQELQDNLEELDKKQENLSVVFSEPIDSLDFEMLVVEGLEKDSTVLEQQLANGNVQEDEDALTAIGKLDNELEEVKNRKETVMKQLEAFKEPQEKEEIRTKPTVTPQILERDESISTEGSEQMVETITAHLKDVYTRLTNLQNENENTDKTYQAARKEQQKDYENKIQRFKEKQKLLSQTISTKVTIEETVGGNGSLREEIADTRRKIGQIKRSKDNIERDKGNHSSAQTELEKLRKKLKLKQDEVDEYEGLLNEKRESLEELKQVVADLEEKHTGEEQRVQELEDEVQALCNNIQKLSEENEKLEKENNAILAKMEISKVDDFDQLRELINTSQISS